MNIRDEIFRTYDIRGIVGESLDRDAAYAIGGAFAVSVKRARPKARCVSVGRDVRLSSDELAGALTEGILSQGLDAVDIGRCPTPLQYFSLYRLNLDGGVMVTGSHNPAEYNGFKLSVGKETLFGEGIQDILRTIRTGIPAPRGARGRLLTYDIVSAYKEALLSEFSSLCGGDFPRLKVVVDAGNGTAGEIVPPLLEALNCDVIPLYCEPDGRFPNHHPDPTVIANIQELIRTTKEQNADFGVGYDGDADRIGVVDPNGDVIWGDQIMVILAREILKERTGCVVIGDVKCSQSMFDDIGRQGGRAIMWKTGHSLVKQKMREEAAVLAGEFSGHIFIADRYFGYDDAIYTTLRIVEILKKTGLSINELLKGLPKMVFTPEIRIDCEERLKRAVVDRVVRRIGTYRDSGESPLPIRDVNTIDGIRVVFEKGWGLVRVSNTQPVIVMRVEAEDGENLDLYRSFLENTLKAEMEAAQ